MENFSDLKGSFSYKDNNIFEYNKSVKSNYSDFYNNNEKINVTDISNDISKVKNEEKSKDIKINIENNILNPLLKIDNKFNFSSSKNIITFNQFDDSFELDQDISTISFKNDEFLEESLGMGDYLIRKFNYPTKDDLFQRCNFLFDNYFEMINKKLFKKKNIRCFLREEKDNEKCNCIPLIQKKSEGLLFYCTKKQKKKYFGVEDLIKFILDGGLLIINQKNKLKENSGEIKDEEINKNDKLRNKLYYLVKKSYKAFQYKFNKYKELSDEFHNYKNNDNLKQIVLNKIFHIYKDISNLFNSLIYFQIIKRFISEKYYLINEHKYEINNNIEQNLNNAKEYLEFRKKAIPKELKNNNRFRIICLIEFYSKNQIKNDIDKNYYIGITIQGHVIIYLLNFDIDLKNRYDEKELYKVITIKKLDIYQPEKINKLECFNNNNNKENNYFLLSSPIKDMAIIINVTSNFTFIETVQKINFDKGLITSVEFCYEDNYYLLFASKGFTLWYFDKKTQKLDYKKIEPKLLEKYEPIIKKNINQNKYRELIYVENKKLFIVQIIYPKKSIEFYTIDANSKEFNLILMEKIILEMDDNNLSNSYNNCCLVNDKFLLIGAKKNTRNIDNEGGIYIINIDKYQIIKYYKFSYCENINTLLKINNNLIVCSSELYLSREKNENNIKIIGMKKKRNRIQNKIKMKKKKILRDNKKYGENNINCNNNNINQNMKINKNDFKDNENNKIDENIKNKINIINEDNNNNIIINDNDKKNTINKSKDKRYRKELLLFKIEEKENGKIAINKINELFGEYYTIDCKKIICESFLICSNKGNNSVIKINENKLYHYFYIKSPFDE